MKFTLAALVAGLLTTPGTGQHVPTYTPDEKILHVHTCNTFKKNFEHVLRPDYIFIGNPYTFNTPSKVKKEYDKHECQGSIHPPFDSLFTGFLSIASADTAFSCTFELSSFKSVSPKVFAELILSS